MIHPTLSRMRAGAAALVFAFSSVPARAETSSAHSLFNIAGEPPHGMASESDAGLALTSGNTDTSSIKLAQQTSYRWTWETIEAQARYLESSAAGVQNAKNWAVGSRYERRLAPRLGAFAGEFLEADPFAGYHQRYATDLGLRRVLWTGDRSKGALEAGYRYQVEYRNTEGTLRSHILRAFGEASYHWNPSVGGLASLEYLPTLGNAADWMLNADFSVLASLTKIFSLKTTYGVRYNHLPADPGAKMMDTLLTTSLVAKFL